MQACISLLPECELQSIQFSWPAPLYHQRHGVEISTEKEGDMEGKIFCKLDEMITHRN